MSKIAVSGNASGTGTFTIESPATNTDRVLTLPDEAGTVLTSASDVTGVTGVPLPNTPNWLAERTSNQNIANNTGVIIVYNTSIFDTDSGFDTSTGRYTVQTGKAGKYYVAGGFRLDTAEVVDRVAASLYKNGSQVLSQYNNPQGSGGEASAFTSTIVDLSEGDIIDIRVFHSASGTKAIQSSDGKTLFMGFRLSE